MGGSAQAVWLCRELRHGFTVRLFVEDRKRAEDLADKLEWVTVLHADVMNSDVLRDERVDHADAFVTVTDDDENNILAAARAKSMGTPMAIAVLQRGTYVHLLEHVGIDRAFSPRTTAVNEIMRRIERGPLRHLASVAEGIAEVFEAQVPTTARRLIDQPLRQLQLPVRCLIAAIQRDDEVFVPGADDAIEAHDTVIVIGPEESRPALRRLFGS